MQIDESLLAYAFTVGTAAFFNPCGFAMLPAYVAHYLSSGDSENRSLLGNLFRALKLGLLVSAGFITIFGLVGVLFALIRSILAQYAFWIGAGMGFLLVVLGIAMLLGRSPLMIPAFERWAGRLSQIKGSPAQRDGLFYYLYGVSYALASLGCATPIFLAVMASAFSGGWLNGVVQFGAYAAGMITMMLAVSLVTAISRGLIKKILPVIMIAFRWIGGLVVLGAGLYLIWYNLIYSGLVKI